MRGARKISPQLALLCPRLGLLTGWDRGGTPQQALPVEQSRKPAARFGHLQTQPWGRRWGGRRSSCILSVALHCWSYILLHIAYCGPTNTLASCIFGALFSTLWVHGSRPLMLVSQMCPFELFAILLIPSRDSRREREVRKKSRSAKTLPWKAL